MAIFDYFISDQPLEKEIVTEQERFEQFKQEQMNYVKFNAELAYNQALFENSLYASIEIDQYLNEGIKEAFGSFKNWIKGLLDRFKKFINNIIEKIKKFFRDRKEKKYGKSKRSNMSSGGSDTDGDAAYERQKQAEKAARGASGVYNRSRKTILNFDGAKKTIRIMNKGVDTFSRTTDIFSKISEVVPRYKVEDCESLISEFTSKLGSSTDEFYSTMIKDCTGTVVNSAGELYNFVKEGIKEEPVSGDVDSLIKAREKDLEKINNILNSTVYAFQNGILDALKKESTEIDNFRKKVDKDTEQMQGEDASKLKKSISDLFNIASSTVTTTVKVFNVVQGALEKLIDHFSRY